MAKLVLTVFSCLSVAWCLAQDCGTPGHPCNDDKQCCGGCCIQGSCKSTYQNCEAVEYRCLESYCGPGFECYIYKPPPDCIGCEPQKECRPYKDS